MTPNQIKHMVDRFLRWKLPENFSPDAGVSFKSLGYMPSGTNLLDAKQAEDLMCYLTDGMPDA